MKKIIMTDCAPKAIGAYSQGVQHGTMLFVSGQLPLDSKTGGMACLDIRGQAKQSLENTKAILEHAGFRMEDVVKTTCFITDMTDFPIVNEVYETYFTTEFPARSCVAVKELPKQALFELEVIACK